MCGYQIKLASLRGNIKNFMEYGLVYLPTYNELRILRPSKVRIESQTNQVRLASVLNNSNLENFLNGKR